MLYFFHTFVVCEYQKVYMALRVWISLRTLFLIGIIVYFILRFADVLENHEGLVWLCVMLVLEGICSIMVVVIHRRNSKKEQ